MALGEAFVNVRADLRPFAKDLEKGLKVILAAAEKKIAADAATGRQLQAKLTKSVGDGVSDGLEQGFDRGMKRGSKKALTTGQRFFAALADFADDGLSAIPAKVKAGIVLGILAASTVVAPLLGGAITAAIGIGLGGAFVGVGVLLANQLKPVNDAFKSVGMELKMLLIDAARSFEKPTIDALVAVRQAMVDSGAEIEGVFEKASLLVVPLTKALTGFVQKLLPGIDKAIRRSLPLFETLAKDLPGLGADLSKFFDIISSGTPEAIVAFRDMLNVFGAIIIAQGQMIRGLTELYFWLRLAATVNFGDLEGGLRLLAEREAAAQVGAGKLADSQTGVASALSDTATEAQAAALAITDLLNAQFASLNATISYEQAIDDLAESIKEGNREFRVTEENGRKNLQLVEQAILGAAKQRDAEILKAAETGRSVESINAAYLKQIEGIEKVIGANARQDGSLKNIIDTAKQVPKDVSVKVQATGTASTISNIDRVRIALEKLLGLSRATIRARGDAAGFGLSSTVAPYANGGIVDSPTLGLIGEAGYKEAVIPDPAVMPKRAMELSNRFGLTQMIADSLGAGQTIVNVFIGSQRLEEIADYRIALNNTTQSQSLKYGPRPA